MSTLAFSTLIHVSLVNIFIAGLGQSNWFVLLRKQACYIYLIAMHNCLNGRCQFGSKARVFS